ncbi:hypothetical protein [Flavilitoribacter nigricans]|uniref:Uncharacterized protein n=1 Tax=Flavilitoribacter nigricans (strain ATCC 23147 / DSM 23189 / NBRC 102662 / NCIMB 1420 / SS-2) TaxID=1122177 RepID=A0A2D0N4J7_FLAN2|nr:hypothetical protein [Flavilitoribacter nigricans]PHN03367.1 hypothetical protein CRP01_27165 [Flavilitoribacter nigricans DSM 23189 = NBRC 102662]
MINAKDLFHKISYLQYPLMLIGLYYAVLPYIVGFDTLWDNLNNLLIFMGLGISFSTLQDTTKVQNEASRRIWENPKKGKTFLTFMSVATLVFIVLGLIGYLASPHEVLQELSFGLIVLGIGFMGMVKSAVEMFENHRKDRPSLQE